MKGIREGKEGNQIFSFTRISLFIPIVFATGILIIGSCTKKYEFTMGNDFLESQTRLQVIDTYKVDLSTVMLDSISTSSSKTALVGSYDDDLFGSVKCETYFDLAYEAFSEIEEKAIYDSSAFILVYSGYSYGDTLPPMSISIHRLTERIEPFTNGYLYNNSSFDYEPEPTGSVSFYPVPDSPTDTAIAIPVNSFGEELFTLIREKDENVSSSEFFYDYIKGFLVTSSDANNRAVIGFTADKENLQLKIYYHLDLEEPEMKEITITMGQESHQFNNVKCDLTNTPLSGINLQRNEKPSTQTDYKGFMQGLVGLLPKIQFPSLQDILADQRWRILKAELLIEPVKSSYSYFKLPEKLYIYDTNKENRVNSVLKDDLGNPMIATYLFDEIYVEDTRYVYDITSFINNELADAYADYDHGLLIGLEQEEFRISLDRLLIEGRNPPVKLKLYYLTY